MSAKDKVLFWEIKRDKFLWVCKFTKSFYDLLKQSFKFFFLSELCHVYVFKQ